MCLLNSTNPEIASKQAALNHALMSGTRAEMAKAQNELTAAVLEHHKRNEGRAIVEQISRHRANAYVGEQAVAA